jgi:uncharacterized protein (TIGR02246 family)
VRQRELTWIGSRAGRAGMLAPSRRTHAMTPANDDLAAIAAIADAFLATWNAHDMPAFAALYADDADFVNVYGLWWQGRQAIADAHVATHLTLFRTSTLALAQPHTIRFVAEGVALCRTHWQLTGIRTRTGKPAADRRGRLLHVLTRELNDNRARWRIAATQNTDITPMP